MIFQTIRLYVGSAILIKVIEIKPTLMSLRSNMHTVKRIAYSANYKALTEGES
jgi:hypothetical protein